MATKSTKSGAPLSFSITSILSSDLEEDEEIDVGNEDAETDDCVQGRMDKQPKFICHPSRKWLNVEHDFIHVYQVCLSVKDDEDVAEEEYDDDKSGRDEILTASSPEHVGGNEEGRSVIKVMTRAGF